MIASAWLDMHRADTPVLLLLLLFPWLLFNTCIAAASQKLR